MTSFFRHYPGLTGPLILALLALLANALPEPAYDYLVYHHDAVAHGQVWRLLSGHFLHTNEIHLALNLLGLSLIALLHHRHYRVGAYVIGFAALGVGISTGLYLFDPGLRWYVGLSGILHGLMLWGAWQDLRERDWLGGALFIGVWIKIAYEWLSPPAESMARLIDARVAIEAHLGGAILVTGYILVMTIPGKRQPPQG